MPCLLYSCDQKEPAKRQINMIDQHDGWCCTSYRESHAAASRCMTAALTVGARKRRPLGVQAGGQAADGAGGVLRAAAGGRVAAAAVVCSTTRSSGKL